MRLTYLQRCESRIAHALIDLVFAASLVAMLFFAAWGFA